MTNFKEIYDSLEGFYSFPNLQTTKVKGYFILVGGCVAIKSNEVFRGSFSMSPSYTLIVYDQHTSCSSTISVNEYGYSSEQSSWRDLEIHQEPNRFSVIEFVDDYLDINNIPERKQKFSDDEVFEQFKKYLTSKLRYSQTKELYTKIINLCSNNESFISIPTEYGYEQHRVEHLHDKNHENMSILINSSSNANEFAKAQYYNDLILLSYMQNHHEHKYRIKTPAKYRFIETCKYCGLKLDDDFLNNK